MSDDETELLEVEVEQSLEATATDIVAIADQLEATDDELTIEYDGQSVTVPAPSGDVEFELEVEREPEDGGVEHEIELEIEWKHDAETES